MGLTRSGRGAHRRAALLALFVLAAPVGLAGLPQKGANARITYYNTLLEKDPLHWPSWAGLGACYLFKAEESGDFSWYRRSEEALKKSLELQRNYDALHYLTAVYVAQHRFAEAIEVGHETADTLPGDTQSYVYLSDAYLAIGEYDRAAGVISRMLEIDKDFYSLSHSARLRFLLGDIDGAIDAMKRALTMTGRDERSRALGPWGFVQLGSYAFAKADLVAAEKAYRQAVALSPGYPPGLEHLAELRFAQGKASAAIELYRKLLKSRQNPSWQAALADAYESCGKHSTARALRRKAIAAYKRSILEGRVDRFRQLAWLYLNHDRSRVQALDLAKKDLNVRYDVYAYDLLAWAHYLNANDQEAVASIEQALKSGIRDARVFFHAGMIYARSGHRERARDHLRKALESNPYFNPAEAAIARRTLARLGS
ncbi:MAG: tetratricopeptide repeat protein [Acidobacteria bacterium]|nr:tetratricopeptide repeat protein [Acidobacteriota bacterium]